MAAKVAASDKCFNLEICLLFTQAEKEYDITVLVRIRPTFLEYTEKMSTFGTTPEANIKFLYYASFTS